MAARRGPAGLPGGHHHPGLWLCGSELELPQYHRHVHHLHDRPGRLFRISPNEVCNRFTAGAARVLGPALAIGFANGVMVLLNEANIMDTVVYYMSNALQGKSPMITLLIIYVFVTCLNFFVVSGSGKAVMMMPILSPLGQILGINQQVMVLTYQLGDGLTNYLWPAGAAVACALCGIDFGKWFRFAIKAIGTMMVAAYILIIVANAINYGPF